jgi:hypothetical protein
MTERRLPANAGAEAVLINSDRRLLGLASFTAVEAVAVVVALISDASPAPVLSVVEVVHELMTDRRLPENAAVAVELINSDRRLLGIVSLTAAVVVVVVEEGMRLMIPLPRQSR